MTTRSPRSRHLYSAVGLAFACLGSLLAIAGMVLLAWTWWVGIVLSPVKRPVPLISVVGLPAAGACGLLSYVCLMAGWAFRSERPGAAWAYLGLLPLAALVLGAIFWVLP